MTIKLVFFTMLFVWVGTVLLMITFMRKDRVLQRQLWDIQEKFNQFRGSINDGSGLENEE